jgi:hypothetical protein
MSLFFSADAMTYLELEDILDSIEFLLISAIDLSEMFVVVQN